MNSTSSTPKAVGHIISADSVQVYTGLQIGANKPTLAELEATPHHLINIMDAKSTTPYNAADWMRDAVQVIQKMTGNGNDDVEDVGEEMKRMDPATCEQNRERKMIIDDYLEQCQNSTEEKTLPVVVGGTMVSSNFASQCVFFLSGNIAFPSNNVTVNITPNRYGLI
jgi:tRNA dimethylallyltransferase